MKITVNIDCTPEEARAFLGLPDLRPVHEVVVRHLVEQVQAGLHVLTPEALLKTWLQPGLAGMDHMVRAFTAAGSPGGEERP